MLTMQKNKTFIRKCLQHQRFNTLKKNIKKSIKIMKHVWNVRKYTHLIAHVAPPFFTYDVKLVLLEWFLFIWSMQSVYLSLRLTFKSTAYLYVIIFNEFHWCSGTKKLVEFKLPFSFLIIFIACLQCWPPLNI